MNWCEMEKENGKVKWGKYLERERHFLSTRRRTENEKKGNFWSHYLFVYRVSQIITTLKIEHKLYSDIVVKITEDGSCAEPRSRQPLPHISYHREHTLPASQVCCRDFNKKKSLSLFLGLSVVTKVRDPEVTIINLKLCRTFGPAVAVTILEGRRKYNKVTSPATWLKFKPAVVSLQTQLEVLLRLNAYCTSWIIKLETTNTIQIIQID